MNMSALKIIRLIAAIVAILPPAFLLINLIFPLELVKEEKAALPLAFAMISGIWIAFVADRKLKRGASAPKKNAEQNE
jgi:hypothetical protein